MKRGPLVVALGVVVAVPAALSCTHTIDGTGGPAPSATGTPSGTAAATCAGIAGNWNVNEPTLKSCVQDSCVITQNGCDLVLDCGAGMFNGTVDGTQVQWQGERGAACTATVGPAGTHVDGTCDGPDGSCTLTAVKVGP